MIVVYYPRWGRFDRESGKFIETYMIVVYYLRWGIFDRESGKFVGNIYACVILPEFRQI